VYVSRGSRLLVLLIVVARLAEVDKGWLQEARAGARKLGRPPVHSNSADTQLAYFYIDTVIVKGTACRMCSTPIEHQESHCG